MKTFIIILHCIAINSFIFSQNFPLKLNRAHVNGGQHPFGNPDITVPKYFPCEVGVNVDDNRPSNCTFDNTFYMYPVLVENFDYKEELPNNWGFNIGWSLDDKYGGGASHHYTWAGNAYNNNNFFTNSGYGYLEWKKESNYEDPTPFDWATDHTKYNYDFTGAFLKSFFKLRQGVFEAKIKLPENPNFWPAYWLYDNQEIDIFEFADGNITKQNNCDTYHHMKMNIHGYVDENFSTNYSGDPAYMTHCNRNRKFEVPGSFFDNDHIYKCVWTDYKVDIYLDNILVSSTNKYYDGPFFPSGACHTKGEDGWLYAYNRSCNYMSDAPDCKFRIWNPFFHRWECIKKNTVKKDISFPETTIPMSLIISNSISHLNAGAYEELKSSWDNLELYNKRIAIDWIKVYQPVVCSAPRYICSIEDFKAITGNTNFLSGSVIQLGNGSSCNLINTAESNFPMHLLASEEIKIYSDMEFVEGTYLRAEIIDCNGGFNQYQRSTNSGEKLYLTDEEIEEIEKRQIDSLMKADPAFRDSVLAYNAMNDQYKVLEVKSATDNGAITIFPNPTDKYLGIDMPDEDFYDLFSIEIIDNLGRSYNVEKANTIDVAFLNAGFYQIKFKFSHGFVVVKNFMKK